MYLVETTAATLMVLMERPWAYGYHVVAPCCDAGRHQPFGGNNNHHPHYWPRSDCSTGGAGLSSSVRMVRQPTILPPNPLSLHMAAPGSTNHDEDKDHGEQQVSHEDDDDAHQGLMNRMQHALSRIHKGHSPTKNATRTARVQAGRKQRVLPKESSSRRAIHFSGHLADLQAALARMYKGNPAKRKTSRKAKIRAQQRKHLPRETKWALPGNLTDMQHAFSRLFSMIPTKKKATRKAKAPKPLPSRTTKWAFPGNLTDIQHALSRLYTRSSQTKKAAVHGSGPQRGQTDFVVMKEESSAARSRTPEEKAQSTPPPPSRQLQPKGHRWAISANHTDLSGHWRPIVTPEFRRAYDEYLKNCSESILFRKLVTSVIALTSDEIIQNGPNLTISGKNPAGTWTRTLVSSGADLEHTDYQVIHTPVIDPDKDLVQVEAWWENEGTLHRSMLRGKPRARGGEFETLRYLEKKQQNKLVTTNDGDEPPEEDILICESYFHPPEDRRSFRPGYVKWRYERC